MIPSSLLIETFIPQTLTTTDDGMGGSISQWTSGTAFRGRLSSIYSGEKQTDNKLSLLSSHKLFCNHMTIDESYRIVNADSSRTFEVKGIIDPSNSHHHMEIYVLEIGTNP